MISLFNVLSNIIELMVKAIHRVEENLMYSVDNIHHMLIMIAISI